MSIITSLFTRDELNRIRSRALEMAKLCNDSILKLSYIELAKAADHIDAMLARSEETKNE